MEKPIFSVSDAVAMLNQTLEYAYPLLTIVGELDSFKIAKQRWVYADIKDEQAKLRCFGSIYQLPGPLEDGMLVEVTAQPRLHPQFGFSLNIHSIRPVGEGSLKKAADKLEAKLAKEGLFDVDRKRQLPFPPEHIALITADGSAAQADFVKITKARWPLMQFTFLSASVQGAHAPEELKAALSKANEQAVEAIVMIRGGGSKDDLSAFNDERVVRAVASSRLPTLVAIGHEVDTSLAEKAADLSASTPSNAAELLVPDYGEVTSSLLQLKKQMTTTAKESLTLATAELSQLKKRTGELAYGWIDAEKQELHHVSHRFDSYHPRHTLARGYALIWRDGRMLKASDKLRPEDTIKLQRAAQTATAKVEEIT